MKGKWEHDPRVWLRVYGRESIKHKWNTRRVQNIEPVTGLMEYASHKYRQTIKKQIQTRWKISDSGDFYRENDNSLM